MLTAQICITIFNITLVICNILLSMKVQKILNKIRLEQVELNESRNAFFITSNISNATTEEERRKMNKFYMDNFSV